MVKIEYHDGAPIRAISDCGRASVRLDAHGEIDDFNHLDGRLVTRGNYADGRGLYSDHPVAASDWAIVVEAMRALSAAREA